MFFCTINRETTHLLIFYMIFINICLPFFKLLKNLTVADLYLIEHIIVVFCAAKIYKRCFSSSSVQLEPIQHQNDSFFHFF